LVKGNLVFQDQKSLKELKNYLHQKEQKQVCDIFRRSLNLAAIDIQKAETNFKKALEALGIEDKTIILESSRTDGTFGRFLTSYLPN